MFTSLCVFAFVPQHRKPCDHHIHAHVNRSTVLFESDLSLKLRSPLSVTVLHVSLCVCVQRKGGGGHFVSVYPSVLLLSYSYFYLDKDEKYDNAVSVFLLSSPRKCAHTKRHTRLSPAALTASACCFYGFVVTQRPSPTSLRFWSALGWLVIMLMQLCSIKVSLHLPAWHHPSLGPWAGACAVHFDAHVCVHFLLCHVTPLPVLMAALISTSKQEHLSNRFLKKASSSMRMLTFFFPPQIMEQIALCVQITYFHRVTECLGSQTNPSRLAESCPGDPF